MILHTVTFKLKHPSGSKEESRFLEKAMELKNITTALDFHCYRQTSPKNNFDFGLTMKFNSQQDYDFYNQHPDHLNFVNNTWLPEVSDFLEIDYEPLA